MKKEGYNIPSYHFTAHLQNLLISLEHQLRSAEILSGLNMGIVEMQVHMDCAGCENKIRKALWKVEGVDDVDIDMAMQKVTVTGWTDRDRVLRTVRKTGRRAEFWPFPFVNPEYHVLGGQHYYYLNEFGPSQGLGQDRINRHPISTYNYYKHGYGGSDYGYYNLQLPAYGSSSSIVGEEAGSVFSDDNPHACTIM